MESNEEESSTEQSWLELEVRCFFTQVSRFLGPLDHRFTSSEWIRNRLHTRLSCGFALFSWNTVGYSEYANYTLSVHAIVLYEADVTDNTYVNGNVFIVHTGNVDAN